MKILPPFWLMIGIALMILIHWLIPIASTTSEAVLVFGIELSLFGMYLFLASANRFRAVETPIRPFTESTELVVTGPFRISRNPMYLGMLLILIGIASELGSITPFIVPVVFFFIIDKEFIAREEVLLDERFGTIYRAYKARVRRWI